MGGLPLHALPSSSATRARFGLVLAATLFATLALPAFASATKFPLVLEKTGFGGEGTVTSSPVGINCNAECFQAEHEYAEGTKVVLTANPKAGSVFSGWFGCDVVSGTKCEVTVKEETYVEAEFNEMESFFLTLEKTGFGGEGTVTSSPAGINCNAACLGDEAEYLEGTKVVLTASAAPGSVFEGWVGCDVVSGTKCEVTVKEETYVEAEFNEIEKFPLVLEKLGSGTGTVTSSPSGISCTAACPEAEAEYLEGTKVVLTASAGTGSAFAGWTGCSTEPSATKCEVTIHEETYVKAAFSGPSKPKYSLIVTTAGTGTGTVSCDGGSCAPSYEQGTKVSLTASAATGSTFSGFSGGGCSGAASCVVTVNGNTAVTATFSANPQPTCATNVSLCPPPPPPSSPSPPGQARVASSARVHNGKAALKITCSGGACRGGFNLTAKVRRGGKTMTVMIGKASFSLTDGASAMLRVKLSGTAKQELERGKAIRAKLSGTSITSSAVKLTPGQ